MLTKEVIKNHLEIDDFYFNDEYLELDQETIYTLIINGLVHNVIIQDVIDSNDPDSQYNIGWTVFIGSEKSLPFLYYDNLFSFLNDLSEFHKGHFISEKQYKFLSKIKDYNFINEQKFFNDCCNQYSKKFGAKIEETADLVLKNIQILLDVYEINKKEEMVFDRGLSKISEKFYGTETKYFSTILENIKN